MSPDESLQNAVMLAKAARAYGMPAVLTSSQEDHIQGPIAPALQDVLPEAYKNRIKRVGIVNAWADPTFGGAVRATGRKNLIMGGVTTDICLIFPSMSAVQEGFNVLAVLDASGSSYEVQENMARSRMERAGVVLTTTNTAIAELEHTSRPRAYSTANRCRTEEAVCRVADQFCRFSEPHALQGYSGFK
jgi:nicotinamidase-related amidase